MIQMKILSEVFKSDKALSSAVCMTLSHDSAILMKTCQLVQLSRIAPVIIQLSLRVNVKTNLVTAAIKSLVATECCDLANNVSHSGINSE